MSHQNVTIRKGTSEKYWYTIAAYVAACVLLVAGIAVSSVEDGFSLAGIYAGVGLILVPFLGIAVYPALFKDAAYVNAMGRWTVSWWYYLGVGLGIPFLVYLGLNYGDLRAAGMMALLSHTITSFVVSVVYLYRRHKYVGVP